jgi:hypothetical protein
MFTIQGTRRTLCDGLSRRALLQIGGLGALGLGLAIENPLSALTAANRERGFGTAKSCLLLFLYGSPPQHETFDPKPDAPAEIQGELKAISTSLPGVQIGEGLPKVSQLLDKLTVVRSLTHEYPLHGVAYAVSGLPVYSTDLETQARDVRHWPYLGSIVDYVLHQRASRSTPSIPRQMALPWMLNSKTDLLVNGGPFAAFLGSAYDPIWTDFMGEGTHKVPKYTDGQQQEFLDPFGGITAAGRFSMAKDAKLPEDLSVERLGLRQSLLAQFNRARSELDRQLRDRSFDGPRERALSLLTSPAIHRALDLNNEPASMRDRYGMTLFGQSCLAARRLIEAGSKFVSVFWDGYGQFANCAWDTHNNHYPRLKEYLLPGFDQAYSGLLQDLESRGLLDETLVLCLSEHGRTPQIDSKPKGAGRHHWSRAYSAVFAGGGIARGRVVGQTDRIAGDVTEMPVSPKDILATALHLLGIEPDTTVLDSFGRPIRLAGSGQVRRELLA